MAEPKPTCPGQYCGRTQLESGEWSDVCGACPRGFRANLTSYCTECTDQPSLYDWQYLGFMVLLPLVLHWFFIDMVLLSRSKRRLLIDGACALLEVLGGAAGALLAVARSGTLELRVCSPRTLADWYTLLHNPQPGYRETLHCTQEAVYPLYSYVLMMYALSLLLTVLLRPWVSAPRSAAIYSALYFYPVLVLIHTVAAGLIYNSFPYVIIIISMLTSASHFSGKEDQTTLALLTSSFTDFRNCMILLGHWLLHAYGLVSITGFRDPVFHGILLTLVPAPAVFYVLTAQFTDPNKIHND